MGSKQKLLPRERLPRHVAIIMDGNGRWARRRGMPRQMGHQRGAKVFREISLYCADRGLQVLTVYAFSTENWSRPQKEIDTIMDLLRDYLHDALTIFRDKNVRVHFLGDVSVLAKDIQDMIRETEESMHVHDGMILNIAINYGARAEIVRGVQQIAWDVKSGKLPLDAINADLLSQKLYTAGQPDPDLIIRPSGELRLSNFLLWQSAYSELWFSDVLWPDFKVADLEQAFWDYDRRNRRFGGV